jgi:RNA polymerase sigma factor (sigma-70 family)
MEPRAFPTPARMQPRRIMARVDHGSAFSVVARVGVAEHADRQVIVDLEARHGQALFGFVRRLGLSDEQAADCVQEVLLRLWTELGRGATILDPKGWAFRSIYRLAMDEHRLRRRIAGLVTLIGGRTSAERPPSADVDRIAVWSEVDRLPERQRHVLYLRYRADLAFDEIGDVLGITASAARSHATQATATLRRRLGTDGHDGEVRQ